MSIQCWLIVLDAGPTANQHWFTISCLLGYWDALTCGLMSWHGRSAAPYRKARDTDWREAQNEQQPASSQVYQEVHGLNDEGDAMSMNPVWIKAGNPCPAKLMYFNFHPLEVVSRYRDPQLQVAENYLYICLLWAHIFANRDVQTHISSPITVIWSTNKID